MKSNKKAVKKTETHDLIIKFDNRKALTHFAQWLCCLGEQQYWEWMKCQEDEEKGNITVINFDYFGSNKKFIQDNTVLTTVGRLDDDSYDE